MHVKKMFPSLSLSLRQTLPQRWWFAVETQPPNDEQQKLCKPTAIATDKQSQAILSALGICIYDVYIYVCVRVYYINILFHFISYLR